MQTAMLTPVYKRGDFVRAGNYRPIVVSSVLHKLYARCVGVRMQSHCDESPGDMFVRQAGFLPHRSTLQNCFVLQHLAHHALRIQQSLHVALLDVSGAYDNADHATMVSTLQQLGFPDHVVRGVAAMYQGLQYRVAVDGKLGPAFPIGIGVKQGCPLSPLLYNLYVQPLSQHLASMRLGPSFPGVPGHHPDWHYADDIALVDWLQPGLQALLVRTAAFLAERHLHLGLPKCVVLLFGPTPADHSLNVELHGTPLPVAPAAGARYLGLIYDHVGSAVTMAAQRAQCFASAFHVATSCMQAVPDFPCCIPAFLKLLHTVIEPAGLYGCELWGLLSLPGLWSPEWCIERFYALDDVLEHKRCHLIRRWLNLPQSTPSLCMLHELGCEPLVHLYVRRAVRLYNELAAMEPHSPYHGALAENVADAFAPPSCRPAKNFVAALFAVLRVLLPTERGLIRLFRNMDAVPTEDVEAALVQRYAQHTTALATIQHGEGSRMGLYFRAVALHQLGVVPRYYHLSLPHGVLSRFLRFRLGCHHLHINTGRWSRPPLPRSERGCLRCSLSAALDDEWHCLIECRHPALSEARARLVSVWFPHSYAVIPTYKHFWQLLDRASVPVRLLAVKYVAICCRVAWSCHLAGGSDAPIDMPAVFSALPEEWPLDLFDSDNEDASDAPASPGP